MPSIFEALETKVATAAKQDTAQTSLTAIASSVAAGATQATLQSAVTALNTLHADLATQATATLQSAGNASLASIDGKTPALVSGAVPVSLPAGQITTLTPPAAITGFATETTTASLLALETAGIRGLRRDADTSPVSDGQSHTLATNAAGRLKTSSWPGAFVATTGTITTASSVVAVDVSRASNVMVTLTGTFVGVNAIFEVSIDGGTTWFGTQAVRTNANTIEAVTGVVATGLAYGWELSVNAMTNFRVRATAYTSGTATVTILPGAYATEPIPAIQTHPVTIAAGAASIGTVVLGAGSASVGTVNSFAQAPVAGAGVLLSYLNAATIALAVVKATSGRLLGIRIYNPNATLAYLQIFNAATIGAVTLGTTLPIEVIAIPPTANAFDYVDFSYNYSAGIVIAATTTPTGAVAVGTGLVVNTRYI